MKEKKLTQVQRIAQLEKDNSKKQVAIENMIRMILELETKLENLTKLLFDAVKEEEDAE